MTCFLNVRNIKPTRSIYWQAQSVDASRFLCRRYILCQRPTPQDTWHTLVSGSTLSMAPLQDLCTLHPLPTVTAALTRRWAKRSLPWCQTYWCREHGDAPGKRSLSWEKKNSAACPNPCGRRLGTPVTSAVVGKAHTAAVHKPAVELVVCLTRLRALKRHNTDVSLRNVVDIAIPSSRYICRMIRPQHTTTTTP